MDFTSKFKEERFPDSRPLLFQFLDCVLIPHPSCAMANVFILNRSDRGRTGELSYPDISVVKLWMSRNDEHSQIGSPGVSHKINLALVEPGTKYIGQFNRVCHKLFRGECAVDVFAIRLAGSTAIPLDYHEFFFEFTLRGVSQIHGGHPGATVQKKQDRKRSVVPANQDGFIYTTHPDPFHRPDTVRPVDGGSASG